MQTAGHGQYNHYPGTGHKSELENGRIALASRLIAHPQPRNNGDNDDNKR